MSRLKSLSLAIGAVCGALGLGFVLQEGAPADPARPLVVSDIVPTASRLPAPAVAPREAEAPEVAAIPAGLSDADLVEVAPTLVEPEQPEIAAQGCDITLTATPAAAAMVDLVVDAPCHSNTTVTMHHSGMIFSAEMPQSGALKIAVPALTEHAIFIAAFDDGEGAVAQTEVPSLPFYDRVAVQWQGNLGVALHAREFGAAYFSDGHIWRDQPGASQNAALGQSGFLTHLGIAGDTSYQAEIYSFPAGTSQREGQIELSVEAEINANNCGTELASQTLELRNGDSLRTQDLSVSVPACDAAGDFLVLKNMFEDLTIARN